MIAALGSDREWTDPTCPVARTVDLVGDRWSLMIVREAIDGAASFTEFHQRLGIARNILTDRLRRLVEYGILTASATSGGKRRTYALTEAGQDLFTIVVALRQWGERHTFTDDEARSTLVDDEGGPLDELRPRNRDGKPVTALTSRVRKAGADSTGQEGA
ncbi:winged helix-turn-helix transcriptional regulator [Nocardia miyunensis]|uniref:winged helix-turn-helix transcriptional regulator n=1 Tax=Nocardia miyunensis TaxID=282684 RepID=UPI000835E84D|nr:helix-turn-helix domain-containing protein [Nocardia miyunensis]